jgi:stage V sporulation protein B
VLDVGKRKEQSLIQGAAVLMCATGLVKILGAVFKIPLGNLIGETGMGYFSAAYNLYLPVYSLAMAGLPIAVSRMVAENAAKARYRQVRTVLKTARRAFLVTGLLGFLIMLAASLPYVGFTGSKDSLPAILFITPSLFFCCIMSAYRGYYEGLRNMNPTAVSSLIEAVGKCVLGLAAARLTVEAALREFADRGTVFGQVIMPASPLTQNDATEFVLSRAAPYAAAAAIAGVTAGSILGAIFLVLRHATGGDGITLKELNASPCPETLGTTMRLLLAVAAPVVLGSMVTQIGDLVDILTVQRRLTDVARTAPDVLTGMYGNLLDGVYGGLGGVPNYLYGVYMGFAYSVYHIVPAVTSVLGISALPAVATAWARKNRDQLRINIESSVRLAALISFPAGAGLMAMSGPILRLLYYSRPNGARIAVPILAVLGGAALFSGVCMPVTNILQAIGRQRIPVRNMAIGMAIKIGVNYTLVGTPKINVIGAPVGTLLCYAYILIANLVALCRHSGVMPNFVRTFLKPLVCSAFCAAAAYAANGLFRRPLSAGVATILACLIGGAVYIITLFIFKTVTKEDVLMLPKGEKVSAVLEKLGWIG